MEKFNAGDWCLPPAYILERWPQVCRIKITFTSLPANSFISTTKISMKYVVNWILLRIRVRSRNTVTPIYRSLNNQKPKLATKLNSHQLDLSIHTHTVEGTVYEKLWTCSEQVFWGNGCDQFLNSHLNAEASQSRWRSAAQTILERSNNVFVPGQDCFF